MEGVRMTNQHLIFLPLLAQVLLTALVWVWMYKTRIAEMRDKGITPQALATTTGAVKSLRAVGPADNFSSLFETPVLFYVAVMTLYITQMVDGLSMILASAFVVFRYLHSFIHVTYNCVMHRFGVYVMSTLLLWFLWGVIAVRMFDRISI